MECPKSRNNPEYFNPLQLDDSISYFISDFDTSSPKLACGNGISTSQSNKCLYQLDEFGHIIGCRSLKHLQNCGKYGLFRDIVRNGKCSFLTLNKCQLQNVT